jgi:AmmeMemoRadiSam system protein A
MEFTAAQERMLLDVARAAIRQALGADVSNGDITESCEDPALMQPAGCFVSLHQRVARRLRGCVGRLDAQGPLLIVVRETAANVLNDPRFTEQPVTLAELSELELDISVLSPLKEAPTPLHFEPLTDGIYLTFGDRAGCFLPQVARETGWTREQLLDRLCTEKLGVPAATWRNPKAQLQVFSTVLVGPDAF